MMDVDITRRTVGARVAPLLTAVLLAAGAGCDKPHWRQLNPFEPAVPPTDTDTFVLRQEGLVQEKAAASVDDKVAAMLAAGRDHFRREEYDKAESFFARVAENEKNAPPAVQEGIYYQAECLRLTGHYPKAADLYSSLLQKFPNSSYREQCVQHMFDIANYWLDDTRQEMKEDKERREGKRTVVMPRFFSTEKAKPFLDREGRAIEKLEQVRLHDINGPLADEALFMCGVIKMYNENYRDADHYFSQIHARHPESKRAGQSLKLAIFCKHMSTGGSDYDGRKAAEARKLVQVAFNAYPDLARDPQMREWLENQRKSIDMQQAEKDFKMAEFYRRTGHPGSAYFYYQLVKNRYPDTKFSQMAEQRWAELRTEIELEQGAAEPAAPQPAKPVQLPAPAAKTPPIPAPAAKPATLPAPVQQTPNVLPAPIPSK
jgi:outer membrane protein assembly factor BamD (BamD/ComL family)